MNGQLGPILRDLARHKTLFSLDHDGLGDALLDIAVTGVVGHFLDQTDPDGAPWAPLSEKYAEWKAKHHPNPIGTLYDLLSREDQIRGERTVSATEASMQYGIDEIARAEARYFSEGGDNRPPRRFYELNQATIERIDAFLEAHFSKNV